MAGNIRRKFWFFLLLVTAAAWGADGEAKPDSRDLQRIRFERAAGFDEYTFEPGGSQLESRDLEGDGWPDFWQAIVDDQNKEYLANLIKIVADPQRLGVVPGEPGSVLRVPFDGTGVALRTKVPRKINPEMAYEISAWARSLRLEHSMARISAIWLSIDADGAPRTEGESHITVPPGQLDWTESPLTVRVNNVPPRATHLLIQISISDNPEIEGADRHGFAWFDDISISARPKIYMAPTFRDFNPDEAGAPLPDPIEFSVRYRGLINNVPEADLAKNNGLPKSYYRVAEITDIFGGQPLSREGKPLKLSFAKRKSIYPGTLSSFPETIKVNLQRLGVYYLTVRLYGWGGQVLAERTQVLGLWLPPQRRNMGVEEAAPAGGFGVTINEVPDAVLEQPGLLSSLVERTGARYAKSTIWPGPENGDLPTFLGSLSRELGLMRRAGVRVTAMLQPPVTIAGTQDLYELMRTRPQNLASFTEKVTSELDTHMENWQWGNDRERSFSFGVIPEDLVEVRKLLAGKTSSPAQSFAIALNAENAVMPPPEIAFSGTMYVPSNFTPLQMLKQYVRLLPKFFWRFKEPDKRLYPPKWLYDLSPAPEIVDETRQPQRELENWVSLALRPGQSGGHDPRLERAMLTDMARKAVLSKVSDIPRVYVDSLLDPLSGLVRIDEDGNPVPMPALLGLRVLDKYLSGAEYLGSFVLRNQFGEYPNYVFARPGGKEAVAVVWLDSDKAEQAEIDFGGGYRLNIVDLQGNISPMQPNSRFIATRIPQIITGMSVPFARTRMSINILDKPQLQMEAVSQNQFLTITNFFRQSISGEISISYAARENFAYEPNWNVEPQRVKFDIGRPLRDLPREEIVPFRVTPPDDSPVDVNKEYGEKLVQLRVVLMGDHPEVLRLIRKTDLTGDIRLTMRRLTSPDERGIDIIQMKVRWIPDASKPHKQDIILRPYFLKSGEMKITLDSVLVPAYDADDQETPPVSIEYRIPREPITKETWIGYTQEDGSRFFRYNASQLVGPVLE